MRQTISVLLTVFVFAIAAVLSLSKYNAAANIAQYDIIIRNGRIIDGSGGAALNADLGLKHDRIAKIGNLKNATATRVIEARGLVVAPGFIDMLGQSETYLLIDPRAMSKVMMGVTTEITGEGESIAPTNERLIKESEDFNKRYNLHC